MSRSYNICKKMQQTIYLESYPPLIHFDLFTAVEVFLSL